MSIVVPIMTLISWSVYDRIFVIAWLLFSYTFEFTFYDAMLPNNLSVASLWLMTGDGSDGSGTQRVPGGRNGQPAAPKATYMKGIGEA